MSLADHLLATSVLTQNELDRARAAADAGGLRLASALARLGIVSDTEIATAFAATEQLIVAEPSEIAEAADAWPALNPTFLRRHAVLPLAVRDGRLRLALADPSDEEAVTALEFATACEVDRVVATFTQIQEALARWSAPEDTMLERTSGADVSGDLLRLVESGSEAPIVRLVQRLLADALKRRASDVHLEPMPSYLSVRFRVDGRLAEVERLPKQQAEPVTSRIKVMASLDIAETRLPQDGRLRLTVQGTDVDVRVSTSPTAHGESVVLRLLGRSELPLDLEKLGMPPASLARLTDALERPHGIILLTGPTGSGKTTTLYAAVNRLRAPHVKILTVEDPIEILLEGINQVQVRPEIDLTYAAALRAFLRQDPDILMVGEMRDGETAEIALRAALTGHLVLSTLHTNSALGAFTRLADLGVEPYLAASTVIATAAQRLIRGLCPQCAESRSLAADEAALFASCVVPLPARVLEPVGCEACQQSGYRGRLPLIEVVAVDDALRAAVRHGTVEDYQLPFSPAESLLGHGLQLVADGRTSLAEVRRAVQLQ